MQLIFGLDLGITSIGWAVIKQNPDNEAVNEILDAGVRIIPLSYDEANEFGKGGNVPTNVARRMARGARRNLQRTKMRKGQLSDVLFKLGMSPDLFLLKSLPPAELFQLRARALEEKLTLPEIGRVFVHLNLRRGYKSTRKEQPEEDGKKQSDYLKEIADRESELKSQEQTIGQRFAAGLSGQPDYVVKQQIFNRKSYIEEFDKIWAFQAKFYPEVLTDANYKLIRDKIMYFQRPLKSQKSLVGECSLEWNYALDKEKHEKIVKENGQPRIVRPKCAPKSSPLAQECKVWESIHNLRIYNERGDTITVNDAQKQQIFNILQNDKQNLTANKLLKDVLKLSPKVFTVDALTKEKGLECNRTRGKLLDVFKKVNIQNHALLSFEPAIESTIWGNPETGEEIKRIQLKGDFDKEPLYQLWHLIYATVENDDLIRLLQEKYSFSYEQAFALAEIDFTKEGYANKSHRAMRRLLPHLQKGKDYTQACKAAGYNHSNSLTKSENEGRTLLDKLDVLPKNSLRNPVVEKILNQMIHVVNDLKEMYGRPDSIRVELARELKQNAAERQKTFTRNGQREKVNKKIRFEIAELLGIQPESVSKSQIEKFKLYEEVEGVSLYSGAKIDLSTFLRAESVDVEHVIPKVRRFDDSFENKTICERKFNQDKNKSTARDFMESQPVSGLQGYEAYLRRIKDLLDRNKISKAKYNRLMMTAEDVSNDTDFIARQLRETQYITKKAMVILTDICFNVYATSGSITDFLRHQWGWDQVIEALRFPSFKTFGMTETKKTHRGTKEIEVIKDWDKRKDHRHHALDALTVACTRQAHIQRINVLNQTLEGKFGNDRRDLLLSRGRDKYIAGPAPFSTVQVEKAMEAIIISFKQGVKVATRSRNKIKASSKEDQITLTPRGSLHEETIYGKIRQHSVIPLNSNFNPKLIPEIVHSHQKELIEQRIADYKGNVKKAFKDLDQFPILYGKNLTKSLKSITVWEYSLVSRKAISPLLSEKSVEKIVDPVIRHAVKERLSEGGGNPKDAFKNLGTNPILVNNRIINRVRILNPAEKAILLPRGYAEPGGNHHIAIYQDLNGKKHEHVVTFWDAFQRIRIGLPAIIKDVPAAYQFIGESGLDVPEDFLLPENPAFSFVCSLAINDMFVFQVDPDAFDFMDVKNKSMISPNIFRVRKLTKGNYWFMHHLETQILEDTDSKKMNRCKQCSISSLKGAVKVRLNRLGHIIHWENPVS
ncbi:MAG: type II CRISPR RNA-guided endonuclease Cas9 [Saprospiraceae bacterium]